MRCESGGTVAAEVESPRDVGGNDWYIFKRHGWLIQKHFASLFGLRGLLWFFYSPVPRLTDCLPACLACHPYWTSIIQPLHTLAQSLSVSWIIRGVHCAPLWLNDEPQYMGLDRFAPHISLPRMPCCWGKFGIFAWPGTNNNKSAKIRIIIDNVS